MKKIVTLCFLLLSIKAFSQHYINQPKTDVKKQLLDYNNKNESLKASIIETDTTILLNAKEPAATAFIYRFDKTGICLSEKIIANSDTSFKQQLQAVLDQKKYEWKKINGNQYISGFAERMLLEISAENKDFIFIIIRTDWSKEMYDILTAN
jgi:hypothetical protein